MKWAFEFKNSRGYRYLCLVQKRWVPGKGPRNVRQLYVGNPEALFRKLSAGLGDLSLRTFPFGLQAALLHAARETGLLEALEKVLPVGDDVAHTAAQLIFLQVLGRVEKPRSRRKMGTWYPESGLPLYWPVPKASDRSMLSALRLLYDTGRENQQGQPILTRARVRRIEEAVLGRLLKKGLRLKYLLFDGTNFYTYHKGSRLFKRGRSKQKRFDLNLAGLGLVTAEEIPVLSEVAPGNQNDVDTFAEAFDALLKRLEHLEVDTKELTMVFDRGVNSEDNFDEILGAVHVIAALDRKKAQTLFQVPLNKFREVARDGEDRPVHGYATRWQGYGRDWRVLVTYRRSTAQEQGAEWEAAKKKVLTKVAEWELGTSQKAVMRRLVQLIPRHYHGVFDYGVEKVSVTRKDGKRVDRFRAYARVTEEVETTFKSSWGKTAIITDLAEKQVSDEELVRGGVLRAEIEDEFKFLKDRQVISAKPVWVWHDAAVPGHIFLCVMGLLLLRYLQWEAKGLGVSVKEMVEELEGIRVGIVSRGGEPGAGGKTELVVERMNARQAELASRFKLLEMLPKAEALA